MFLRVGSWLVLSFYRSLFYFLFEFHKHEASQKSEILQMGCEETKDFPDLLLWLGNALDL